ncbi:hypothetical protein [Paenibacillus pinisoli]|uniref:hypothetical protein n=1 Tax=Paenibacillus pinisoli TaxID=1276110 RepID=UPI001FB2AB2F|nr:hypothetical protein [Paenibacillus pinisoli]
MIRYYKRIGRAGIGLLAAMIMLSGCGAAKPGSDGASSFGDAVVAASNAVDGGQTIGIDENSKAAASDEGQQSAGTEPGSDEFGADDGVGSNQDAGGKSGEAGNGKSDLTGSTVESASSEGETVQNEGSADKTSTSTGQKTGLAGANGASDGSDEKGAGEQGTGQNKPGSSNGSKQGTGETGTLNGSKQEPVTNKPGSSNSSKQEQPAKSGTDGKSADAGKKPASGSSSSSKYPQIGWNEFFDNEEQTTPSNRFWDLSDERKTVQIKGFMGEVLSFNDNWFLLIPEPGAECPFDNGDETYWNKIMIVFVKDGSKLRYTNKPLKLTGRLDVGVKVDESGYKTMFRLYDAKFEEIKE